jgi:hypothetical protein
MADARDIINLVQTRVKRVLDLAEITVPADKFEWPRHTANPFNDARGTCE